MSKKKPIVVELQMAKSTDEERAADRARARLGGHPPSLLEVADEAAAYLTKMYGELMKMSFHVVTTNIDFKMHGGQAITVVLATKEMDE